VASQIRADLSLHAGYVVGSLALIADAYHMLNDSLSLVIALYAIKVLFSPRIFCDLSAHVDPKIVPLVIQALRLSQVYVWMAPGGNSCCTYKWRFTLRALLFRFYGGH